MSFEEVIAELKERYQAAFGDFERAIDLKFSNLTNTDIERWSSALAISKNDLYARIALELAHGYHQHQLPFTFCDAIVNDIYGTMVATNKLEDLFQNPDLFWRVFMAFDEGEFFHSDDRNEDPGEKYTRPMISEIVAKFPRQ